MADRRTSERLLVPKENLEHVPYPDPVTREEALTDDTQPMRLSFLALLADRDPAVQTRLERRRTLALEDDLDDEEDDRPTDPMVMLGG